jgi:hypothetical protein
MRYALRKGQERLAMLEGQRRDLDEAIAELFDMTRSVEKALLEREAADG